MSKTATEQHKAFLRRAIALSVSNVESGNGGPFGAVIVRAGEVLAETGNSVFTSNDPTAHAEVNAIRAACQRLGAFRLDGCILYSSCEPCPMCLAAAYWAHVECIFYAANADDAARAGFDDAFLYRELTLPVAQRTLPAEELLREEAQAGFRAWDVSPYKQPY